MQNEWSFVVDSQNILKEPSRYEIEASEEERGALARRLGVVSVDSLRADLVARRTEAGRVIYVSGELKGVVQQSCVVSGEPVEAALDESIEGWFADPEETVSLAKVRRDKSVAAGHTEQPILDEKDDPEPIIDGGVDLAELVVQHLSLALDPYPHAPGVHFELGDDNYAPDAPKTENPFAALKDWKKGSE